MDKCPVEAEFRPALLRYTPVGNIKTINMQTILGAGGAIGKELATYLRPLNEKIRLVSRHPVALAAGDELFAADLLDAEQTREAVAGSSIVYLVAGLVYQSGIWEKQWPLLIHNVIAACEVHQAKLVFFDNIYMYDPDHLNGMDERTPINPSSRKGKVREQVAEAVLSAHREGRIQALIARSADFYGLGISTSMLHELVIKNVSAGKRPQWVMDADQPHNFTYTPDAGRATAQLGNDPEAYGRVWHLPTPVEAPTGREWSDFISKRMGKTPQSPMILRPWMLRLLGLFIPTLRSMVEMLYQYDRPYVFDSSDFTKRYGWKATPITEWVFGD